MKFQIKRANSFLKDFILFSRLGLLLKPFSNFTKFLSNLSLLAVWIRQNGKKFTFSDFYKPVRNYANREKLRAYVLDNQQLAAREMHYLEFGVLAGDSFKWWVNHNTSPQSRFFGFDTFEGLPESWVFYKKGDMSANMPVIPDDRVSFYKGLFQETLYGFLENYRKEFGIHNSAVRVIHLDADLYSSTLFALTMLAPYLRSGDIILFDEFNVPNHEFAAWNDFIRSFYLKYEPIGTVNNFYQVAFRLI